MELEMSAHRIDGKECSSWPTPLGTEIDESNGNVDLQSKSITRSSGKRYGLSLTTVIHLEAKKWPTPHSSCSTGPGRQGRQGGENLQTAVNWPTPTTPAGHADGRIQGWALNHSAREKIVGAIGKKQTNGQLNPEWVQWLMNFPPGWTEV